MKKLILLVSAVSAATIFALATTSVWLLNRAEVNAEKERLAFCEILAIGQTLNEEFVEKGNYPAAMLDSVKVRQLEGSQLCRGTMRASDLGFLDPWGKEYVYEQSSNRSALISSSSKTVVKLIDGDLVVELTAAP